MDNTILTFSPEDLITTSGKYDKYNCTNISEIDMELTLVANTDPVRSNPFSDSMLNETVIEYSDAINDSPNNTFNRKNPFRNSLDYMEENLQDLSDSLEINTTIKHNYLNTSLVVNVSNNSTLSSLFHDEDGMLFKNNMASSVTPTNRVSVITPLKNIELLEEKNGKPFESIHSNFQRSFTPYTANKTHNVKDVTFLYNINDSSYLNLNKIDIEQTSINFKKIEKIDFDITTTKTDSDEECYQNDKQLLNLDESRVGYNSKEIKKEELKLTEQAYLKRPDLHTMQDQLFLNENTSNNDSSSCVNFEATNVDMKLNKELVKHDQIKSNLIDRESNNINSLSSENLVEHTEEESDAEEETDESNDISIDWDLINELWKKLYPTTSSNKQNTNTPNNHNIERVIKNEKENSSNQKTGIQKISDFPRNKKKSFCSEVCDDTHNIKDTIISLEQLDLSSENNFKGSASKELIKEGSILQKATVNNINSTNENTQSQERKNSQKINVTKNNYCNSKNRFITKNRKRFGGNYNKKTEGPNLSKDHRSIKKVIEKTQQKNLVGVWKVENIKDCNKKGVEKENVNSFKGQKFNKKFRKTCKYSIIPLKTEITKKMTFKEFTKEQKSESNYKENKQLYRCASGEFKADLLKNEFKKSNVLSEKVQLNNIINNLGGCSTISIKNDSNTLRNDSLKNDRKSHTFNKIKSAIMNMSLLQSRRESLQTTPYKESEDSCINLKNSTVDINNKSLSSNQFRKTKVEFKELIPNIFKKKSTAIQPQNKNVILKAIKPKNEIIDTEEHRIESTAINNKIFNSTTNVDNVINSEESSEMKDFKIKSTQTLILNSSVKKATFLKEPKIADTDSVYSKVLPKLRISVKETDHGIEYTSHLVENCSNHVENSKDYINYRLGRCDEIISRRYTKRFHRNDPKKRLCRYQKYLQQSKKDIDLIKQSKKIICWALGDIKGNLTIVNGKNNN